MEGTLFKTTDGSWYVITGICGFSEVVAYEIHPDYVKGYLLQDEDEGNIVKFEIVTRLVYDAIKHKSIEVPVYAILHKPIIKNIKKQTAVEYAVNWLTPFISAQQKYIDELLKEAKEMEKQQMEEAVSTGISKADMTNNRGYFDFDKYYNETYK